MTARDAITAALRKLGALAAGESLEASEATDGLSALSMMFGSWSTNGLMVYTVPREEFSLTAGDQQYSMGSGGDFNTTRPVGIERATIEDQSASPTVEYPLEIVDVKKWAEIALKETGNSIPTHLYTEGTYPTETLNFYPKPQSSLKVVLYSRKPLAGTLTLDSSLSYPPGYEEAIVYNLAVTLAPDFGKSVSPEIASKAVETLENIMRANHRPYLAEVDRALQPRGGFDIYTGGYR